MVAVKRIEAPTKVHSADDAERSNADGDSWCSGEPARKSTPKGARGCADEQQQLGVVARRREHARRTSRSLTRHTSDGQQDVAPMTRWIACKEDRMCRSWLNLCPLKGSWS
ncbi:hypothetical protein Syun_009689 [Stephania yunnanensis]|uniref:Uncharacterized protein n=1 Tax=Stephania yunnanensis TaxID=152371 RepID=A0AAP0KHL9_9MAGN